MSEYISYHGTDRRNKKSIKKNGFKLSSANNEWLGFGVYFFIDGASCPKKNAKEWATNQAWDNTLKKNTYPNYSVLEAKINADNVLDLRISDDLALFDELRNEILQKYNNSKAIKNTGLTPDTFLCNAISTSLELDILINNQYIKNKNQRMSYIASRIPNVTILCAKKEDLIEKNSIKEIDYGSV